MATSTSTTVRRSAAALWIVAGVGYLATESIVAARAPDYSYVGDYVSDLGRAGSPLAWWMNAAFRVQGMAFIVAGALTVWAGRPRRGALRSSCSPTSTGPDPLSSGCFRAEAAGPGSWCTPEARPRPSSEESRRCHGGVGRSAGRFPRDPGDRLRARRSGAAVGSLAGRDRSAHRRLRARRDLPILPSWPRPVVGTPGGPPRRLKKQSAVPYLAGNCAWSQLTR